MLSLRVQLLVSHLILVLLLALVMSGAIERLFVLRRSLREVTRNDLNVELAAERMREALSNEQVGLTICLIGHPELGQQRLTSADHDFNESLHQARASLDTTVIHQKADQVAALHQAYRMGVGQFLATYQAHGRPAAEGQYMASIRPVELELTARIKELLDLNRNAMADSEAALRSDAGGALFTAIGVTVIAVLLALTLALRMVRMALTPLSLLAKQAEIIGGGDLTRRIDLRRTDEIGALAESFNSMAEKLADLRKSEVRRLQRAERMSDIALESLYDPVVVTDARGRIVHLNSAAEGIFGSVPDSRRIPVEEHISDRRIVRAIQRAVQQVAVSADESDAALIPVQVEGTQRTYRLRSNPMFTDDGLVLGSVTVLEDVTHLKEVERLKNEFIGVASHELRTPVTSLLLSSQLLSEGAAGPLNDSQKELIQAQQVDLERLDRLMRELLDITRLEAGTMVPRLAVVPALELLQVSADSVQAAAASSGVTLSVDPSSATTTVYADRSQVQRVIVNLANNAIRHTKAGGRVTLRSVEAGDEVRFEVEDTGSGIPEDYLAKIFDRFVQVPGATQGGAGLGLAISRTIIEAHGGRMAVSSRLGVGSTFSFTLRREGAPTLEN